LWTLGLSMSLVAFGPADVLTSRGTPGTSSQLVRRRR
jgi:hypothetical protein